MFDLTGKIGLWIHNPGSALGRLHEIQSYGFDYVIIKISDGIKAFHPLATENLMKDARSIGLGVVSWSYIYEWADPHAQTEAIVENLIGCDNLVIDAEGDWETISGANKANHLMTSLTQCLSKDISIHLSSFYWPDAHSMFPWDEFLRHCKSYMPQSYQEGQTNAGIVALRTRDSAMKLADKSVGGCIIPTINTPELLEMFIKDINGYDGFSVWLWDGSGNQNSQIANPGDDEGVMGLHGLWIDAIGKIKNAMKSEMEKKNDKDRD